MSALRLDPTQLRRRCDPTTLGFIDTRTLAPAAGVLGQARAEDAFRFGVGMRRDGYNLFVLGRPGIGKRSLARHLLEESAAARPAPDDWCYVNNFNEPTQPIALQLPRGRAIGLKRHMERFVEDLRTTIPGIFESDEYRARFERIEAEFNERQGQALETLGTEAAAERIALVRTPVGFSVAPMHENDVMPPQVFEALPEAERRRITERITHYQERLEHIMRDVLRWRRERSDKIRALNREVTEFAVAGLMEELKRAYEGLPEVLEYFAAARTNVVEHADDFKKPPETQIPGMPAMMMREPPDFRRYQVNVLVHHEDGGGAPVVSEDNPLYTNLVGRVEHIAQFGALSTDFNLIRAGALHRANGGYLILDAAKLLAQPYAWEGLKRAISTREIRIESLGQIYGFVSTRSLEPEPIPLDVKIVLVGTPMLYYLLEAYDPEFPALFKIAADFEDDVDWTDENVAGLARLLGSIAARQALLPLAAGAVAAIVERCARLAGDAQKLSVHLQSIEDLAMEADFFARRAGRALIEANDVQAAIDAGIERADRIRVRSHEAIRREILLIDTDGAKIGQINGLSVATIGKLVFAQPTRITATARLGKGELIDIQREVNLSGAIHSKGVLTLSAFLATRFAVAKPFSLAATLSFEQTYGGVDGDSASVAELCALVSAIAEVPIRQDLAVTGSVNQQGTVQAIGAVNDKIEGFFDVCNARGLTGGQGVIIPKANRQHLMLRADVVEACRAGRFHVHAIDHVDEAIGLLMAQTAAAVNALAAARLEHFGEVAIRLARPPERRAMGPRAREGKR